MPTASPVTRADPRSHPAPRATGPAPPLPVAAPREHRGNSSSIRSVARWLSTTPDAVSVARAQTAATLTQWQLPELLSDAQIVISELGTNAINASVAASAGQTGGDRFLAWFAIRLSTTGRQFVIDVFDSAPGSPVLRSPDPLAGHGQGLRLVDELTTSWSVFTPAAGSGKVVSAVFDHDPIPDGPAGTATLPRRAPTRSGEAWAAASPDLLSRVRTGLLTLPERPRQPSAVDPLTALSLFTRPADGDLQP